MNSNNSDIRQRVFDYFLIAGLPISLTVNNNNKSSIETQSEISSIKEHEKLLYPLNFELESQKLSLDPIVDLAIINKTLNESVPIGYECIWLTPERYSANLIHDTFIKSNELFLCYKRGKDKPPILDIGVFYEGTHERVMEGCIVIRETVGGNSANLNNSTFTAERIYITYRRGNEMACNSLAVIDICIIAKFKDEIAPHTFNEIHKKLNRNLTGKSVHICYKKAWIPAPQIKYIPTILFRYPQQDHADLPFPNEVALFGLPMGAVIESWPLKNKPSSKPLFSTFVLNVNSDDGIITEKVYGSCITFYEKFDIDKLSSQQKQLLNLNENITNRNLYSNKCLIVLSRHPLFQSYKEFLIFLYHRYSNIKNNLINESNIIKIEQYLAHLIFEVPFPTSLKPKVLINLTEREDDCISISWPNDCILPQSGASFIELLCNLGVENSINVFLFILLQRNVMFHSLRRAVLTGVVEAISCIIFPFIWRYTYLPMCPLKLCDLIEAPGSFILGMDTRFFDLFDLPSNVLCVDLDTNTLSSNAERKYINLKVLPRKALSQLQSKLTDLSQDIESFHNLMQIQCEKVKTSSQKIDLETKIKRQERIFDLAIREAFLKFMATILFNYKSFLKTNTRKPIQKARDRNLGEYFDTDGFLRSKETSCQYFYKELVKTQLFYDCIMNLSFTSELDPVLADAFAFFAEICTKINPNNHFQTDDVKLIDLDQHNSNNQTMVILPPTPDSRLDSDAFIYDLTSSHYGFPKLKCEIISRTNSINDLNDSSDLLTENGMNSLDTNNSNAPADTQSIASSTANQRQQLHRKHVANKIPNTPLGVRTNAEKLQAQKKIENKLTLKITNNLKINEKNKQAQAKFHAFCFLSNAYALWFVYLPEYLKACEENARNGLNYAYQVLIQMQKHNLTQPDEICFRIMMQLSLIYRMPTVAVRTLLHMRKHKIELNPITYSYYNKAITECWESSEQDRWAKLKLYWHVVYRFKKILMLKKEREKQSNKKNKKKSSSGKTLKRKKIILTNSNTGNNRGTILIKTNNNASHSQLMKYQPKIEIIESKDQKQLSFNNLKVEIKKLLVKTNSTKFKYDVYSNVDQNDLNKKLLHLKSAGIIWLSKSLILNIPTREVIKKVKSDLSLNKELRSLVKITFISSFKKKESSNSIFLSPVTSVTQNDPLGAFNSSVDTPLQSNKNHELALEKVKKRLFDLVDYVPFSSEQQSIPVSNQTNNSDFIFHKKGQISASSNDIIENNSFRKKEIEFIYNQNSYNREYDDYDQDEEDDEDEYFEDEDEDLYEEDIDSDEYDDDSNYDTSYEEVYENRKNETDSYSMRNNAIKIKDLENGSISSFSSKKESAQLNINNNNNNKISNLSLNEQNENVYETNNFTSPITPFLGSKVMSFMRKWENSLENSSSKLKNVSKFITDKTQNIKEVILSNTNQQDITSRLKSMSNYNLGSPHQYLNGLIKSNTNLNDFVSLNNNSKYYNGGNDARNLTPSDSVSSQTSLDKENNSYLTSIDLNPIPNDETFKQLSIKWWGIDNPNDYLNFFDFFDENKTKSDNKICDNNHDFKNLNDALIDLQISSCNYCENCESFLYDEEIMSGWTLKDSDLNIKCFHCSSYLVPNLYIKIQDLENIKNYLNVDQQEIEEEINNERHANQSSTEKSIEDHPFVNLEDVNNKSNFCSSPKSKKFSHLKINQSEFTVQYLSPLVVRKELENIIIHMDQNEENKNLIDSKFIEEHSVVFWNLIWYFKRIGVDYGQLAIALLNSRLTTLLINNNIVQGEEGNLKMFKFKDFISNSKEIRPYNQHPNVKIRCMWDNLKLQDKLNTHEVPLYLGWIISNQTIIQEQLKQRLITTLTLAEIKSFRKSNTNRRSLATLFESITRNIKESNIAVPMRSLLRERSRSKINYSSIYREILFLVLVALEREYIDIDAFDTEYRAMYRTLLKSDTQEVIKSSDKPPDNVAVWCRRLFSPLLI